MLHSLCRYDEVMGASLEAKAMVGRCRLNQVDP
jgi:hypothetical protein